jgi:hypothetical protein
MRPKPFIPMRMLMILFVFYVLVDAQRCSEADGMQSSGRP